MLRPRNGWTTAQTQSGLVDAIRKRLAEIPGISVLMSQPIQERVDELISGIRTECAIKLFGDDLDSTTATNTGDSTTATSTGNSCRTAPGSERK